MRYSDTQDGRELFEQGSEEAERGYSTRPGMYEYIVYEYMYIGYTGDRDETEGRGIIGRWMV